MEPKEPRVSQEIKSDKKVENIETREIFSGSVNVSILGTSNFLREDPLLKEVGWSLRGLNSQADFQKPEKKHIIEYLKNLSEVTGVKAFKVPIAFPVHNGKLNIDDKYNEVYEVEGLTIMKGANFEGCEVKMGECFLMAPADCATVVVQDSSGKTYAMHAGRESIFNPADPSRETLVRNIIDAYGGDKNLKVWAGFSISPGTHFTHPEEESLIMDVAEEKRKDYATLSKLRREFLTANYGETCYKYIDDEPYLDLLMTIKNMCLKEGILENNIELDDSFCTFKSKDEKGNSRFYSYRRDGTTARNLIVVRKNK